MLAVIVVRDGMVPAGADETISECDGRAALVGSGTAAAAIEVQHVAREIDDVRGRRLPPRRVGRRRWRTHFADEPILVLPASPDGRDLAPRLAAQLQRPLYAMCMSVSPSQVDLIRRGRHRAALDRAARRVRGDAAARRAWRAITSHATATTTAQSS